MTTIRECAICGGRNLTEVWDLPDLPLTERFGPYSENPDLRHDQLLVVCDRCSHAQLANQLDPTALYTAEDYAFRTSSSASGRRHASRFVEFLDGLTERLQFRSFVDVGGNDLYLARLLEGRAIQRAVVDPICSNVDGQIIDGVSVVGRMLEEIDLSDVAPRCDLIACRHTLEHVSQPRAFIEQLFRQTGEDALFVFETPDFDMLMEALRYDAVFHQHYHYYTLTSLMRLLAETGGEYLSHAYNTSGPCGGSLFLAFRKARQRPAEPTVDPAARSSAIHAGITAYSGQMRALSHGLLHCPRPLYGYGASLMLATLAYHLKFDLSEFACIFDDDPGKDGATYENVPVTVRDPQRHPPERDASYLVTSLENVRPILSRVMTLHPRRVFVPTAI